MNDQEFLDGLLPEVIDSIEDGAAIYSPSGHLIKFNDGYLKFISLASDIIKPGVSFRTIFETLAERGFYGGVEAEQSDWVDYRVKMFEEGTRGNEFKRDEGVWARVDYYRLSSGGTFVIAADISERKQMEEDLRSSRNRLRAIFKHAPLEINLKDKDGNYTELNPRLEKIINRPGERLVGLQPSDVHEPERAQRVKAHDQSVLQTGDIQAREELVQTEDGPRSFQFIKFPTFDESGTIDGVGTLISDITDMKEVETRLRQARDLAESANQAKSEFLATMSHELRTPLTSIKACIGLMGGLMSDEMSDDGKTMLEIANKNCETLLLLINDLLDFEKIISGTMAMDIKQHDLGVLVHSSIETNQVYAQSHSVRFHLNEPQAPRWAEVDEHRFAQIMRNLLSNAAKFSPADSTVEVSVLDGNEEIIVTIRDQGIGISEEHKESVFERFIQIDSSDNRQRSGSGLGLSITKAFVEGMEGVISFESEIGKGTTFYISFPAANNPPASQ